MAKIKNMRTQTMIALSFLLVIIVGSLLLTLPISQVDGSKAGYIDNLFVSVSATCVTGLFTESLADSYNLFGKLVVLTMIQIGGLGSMTFYGMLLFILRKKMPYRQKRAMAQAVSYDSVGESFKFIKRIVKYTFIIELTGVLILAIQFIPEMGVKEGTFTSIFLSISAFCNAGFDPFGNISLIDYSSNLLVNLTVMALIILGGIGFGVWFDVSHSIKENKSYSIKNIYKRLSTHSKLTILMYVILTVLGTVLVLITEWDNPLTFKGKSFYEKFIMALFQSVTMRTAGFATMDYTLVRPITLLIWSSLMFVGGGSAGAAGGMKVTTLAVIVLFIKKIIYEKEYFSFNKENISDSTVRSAVTVGSLYLIIAGSVSMLIQFLEPDVEYVRIVFETISALCTVGVSAGLTTNLSLGSLILIMLSMYIGRVAPVTIMSVFVRDKNKKTDIRYADSNILVG